MKLIQKQYKADKITEILNAPQFFIAQQGNIDSQTWIDLKHKLQKDNIKIYKLQNNLVKKVYNQNRFKNFNKFIQGPLIIVYSKDLYNFEKITQLLSNFTILCFKDNYKFYTPKEFKSLCLTSGNSNINFILEIMKLPTMLSFCLNKLNKKI